MTGAVQVGVWLVLTAGHFLLTVRAATRLLPADRPTDGRVFHATLIGVGSLVLILHGAALMGGATLGGTSVALLLWHAGLLAASRGRPLEAPVVLTWPERAARRVRGCAPDLGPRGGTVGGVLLLLIGTGVAAPALSARALSARQSQDATEAAELAALASGDRPLGEARELYLRVVVAEAARGRQCVDRRFFALVRFDEPLALQGTGWRSQVLYAGWEVGLAAGYGPLAPCDYEITSEALRGTVKGAALEAALAGGATLVEIGRTERFVLLAWP